jgi:endoglucanase
MKRPRTIRWQLLAFACCSLSALACRPSATGDDVKNSPEGKACPATGKIEDGEDNNNQVIVQDGRSGYMYTFVDTEGSTITPTAGAQGGVFQVSPGGANGSQYAVRMTGSIGQANVVFAGMGMNFVDPKGPYDASKYKGISFWAKKSPGTTPMVRLKVPDKNTDPDGGVCSACFNDFGRDLNLTDEWTEYVIPFFTMSQLPGWGSPHVSSIDSKGLYAIQFQVNEKGQKYDIWVDDVAFTGCE